MDRQKFIDEFSELLVQEKCTAFLGAGCSMVHPLHLPSWKQMVKELIDKCNVNKNYGDSPFFEERFLTILEKCKSDNSSEFNKYIEEKFDVKKVSGQQKYPQETSILMQLGFHTYITTNYDSSLEEAAKANNVNIRDVVTDYTHYQFEKMLRSWARKQKIVYLHGRYDNPSSCIATAKQYDEMYSTGIINLFLASLITHPTLFVGFSLKDPDIMRILHELQRNFSKTKPDMFALLPWPTTWNQELVKLEESHYRDTYGIEIIFYQAPPSKDEPCKDCPSKPTSPSPYDHKERRKILNDLLEKVNDMKRDGATSELGEKLIKGIASFNKTVDLTKVESEWDEACKPELHNIESADPDVLMNTPMLGYTPLKEDVHKTIAEEYDLQEETAKALVDLAHESPDIAFAIFAWAAYDTPLDEISKAHPDITSKAFKKALGILGEILTKRGFIISPSEGGSQT